MKRNASAFYKEFGEFGNVNSIRDDNFNANPIVTNHVFSTPQPPTITAIIMTIVTGYKIELGLN